MSTRIAQGLVLAAVLVVGSALPAAAQSLGAGISFMGDERGTGVLIDYSKPFREPGEYNLGWVGDFRFYHHGEGNELVNGSLNTLMIQGGVRASGEAGSSLNWLAQGLVGFHRSSGDIEVLGGSVCDTTGVDCSDTGPVLTISGGVEYALNEKSALRGQLDLPIFFGSGDGTAALSIVYVMKLGR